MIGRLLGDQLQKAHQSHVLQSLGITTIVIGLLSGAGYISYALHFQHQQGQLQQIRDLKTTGEYDQCINTAKTFPNNHAELYRAAEVLLDECQQLQEQQLALEKIGDLKKQTSYDEGIRQAKAFPEPQSSELYQEAQKLLGEMLLAKAKQLVEQGSYVSAITTAFEISSDASVYGDARQFISDWSHRVLELADEQYQGGDLNKAVEIAGKIPENSPVYAQAQEKIKQWQAEWKANADYLKAAETAVSRGRWNEATAATNQITTTTEYWRQQKESITQRANAGKVEAERRRRQPLNVTGRLTNGSPTRTVDDTPYRDHTFVGQADQTVTITMESSDFDTRIFIVGPGNQLLIENDDAFMNGYDSAIRNFTLPTTGTYRVRANAYTPDGRGQYHLLVNTVGSDR